MWQKTSTGPKPTAFNGAEALFHGAVDDDEWVVLLAGSSGKNGVQQPCRARAGDSRYYGAQSRWSRCTRPQKKGGLGARPCSQQVRSRSVLRCSGSAGESTPEDE